MASKLATLKHGEVGKDDPEALAMFRDAMKGQEGGDKRSQEATTRNNVTGDEVVTGNSRAYSIDRVKRECEPEAKLLESPLYQPPTAKVIE